MPLIWDQVTIKYAARLRMLSRMLGDDSLPYRPRLVCLTNGGRGEAASVAGGGRMDQLGGQHQQCCGSVGRLRQLHLLLREYLSCPEEVVRIEHMLAGQKSDRECLRRHHRVALVNEVQRQGWEGWGYNVDMLAKSLRMTLEILSHMTQQRVMHNNLLGYALEGGHYLWGKVYFCDRVRQQKIECE
jgi:hypothetical protein